MVETLDTAPPIVAEGEAVAAKVEGATRDALPVSEVASAGSELPRASGTREPARARSARAAASRSIAPKTAEKALPAGTPVVEAPAAASAASGQLGDELALLSEVRSSIQGESGERALELLNRYEARFGQPILGMEADALRVDALCKAGRRDAARERARAFRNEWPGSPLEQRVSAACP